MVIITFYELRHKYDRNLFVEKKNWFLIDKIEQICFLVYHSRASQIQNSVNLNEKEASSLNQIRKQVRKSLNCIFVLFQILKHMLQIKKIFFPKLI